MQTFTGAVAVAGGGGPGTVVQVLCRCPCTPVQAEAGGRWVGRSRRSCSSVRDAFVAGHACSAHACPKAELSSPPDSCRTLPRGVLREPAAGSVRTKLRLPVEKSRSRRKLIDDLQLVLIGLVDRGLEPPLVVQSKSARRTRRCRRRGRGAVVGNGVGERLAVPEPLVRSVEKMPEVAVPEKG